MRHSHVPTYSDSAASAAVIKQWSWRILPCASTSTVCRSARHRGALARERFRVYWTRWSSKGGKPGRPPLSRQIRELIETLAKANPLWHAPRIHGELRKLGINVSERTVSRILATLKRSSTQSWRTFFKNHIGEIVATDFFTVPTVGMRVVFVFLVFAHDRRKVLHFGVTEHPTSQWTGQQVVEAFADRDAARYLIRDRDGAYGNEFRQRVQSLGTQEILTVPRSPLAETRLSSG